MRSRHQILYIDDDADDVSMLRTAFDSLNVEYEILEAYNGEEGLQKLEQMKEAALPDLIILDINMPKMDGRETFTALKKDPVLSSIPLVVFSTSSSPLDKMFFSRNNVEYIVKPVDFQKMSDVARTFLNICDDYAANSDAHKKDQ